MKLRLEQWLIIVFSVFNFLLVGAISIAFYTQIKQSMLDRTLQQLQSINILKYNLIDQFLENRKREIKYIINSLNYNTQFTEVPAELLKFPDLKALTVFAGDTSIFYGDSASIQAIDADTIPEGITAYNGLKPVNGYLFTFKDNFTAVFFFKIDELQEILLERTGMGTSGESYLVNPDSTMQTRSRFFPWIGPGEIMVNTRGVMNSLANKPGLGVYPDYRGVSIVGAYRLFEFDHIDWVLLTEIDFAEAMQPVIIIRNRFVLISGFIILLSFLISVLIARNISKPIHFLHQSLVSLSQGILPKKQVEVQNYIKEIEQITRAINQLIIALRRTSYFAKSIGRGKFNRTYKLLSSEDELGRSIVAMRDQLVALNQHNENLEKETKRLLVATEEKERERISRDLHDGIGPLLTSVKLKISALGHPHQQEIINLIDETLQEVRRLSRNLMPSLIRDFGPGVALEQLVNDLSKNLTKIEINFVNAVLAEDSGIDNQVGIAIYRIGQESLNNAIKHANATKINMSVTEFEDHVNFYIQDNGKGFDPAALQHSLGKGIINIRERVNMLNGDLVIESSKEGTTIEAIIPIT